MQLPFWHTIDLGVRLPSHLDNGLSQPHFQTFFSPQTWHSHSYSFFFISSQVNTTYEKYKNIKNPAGKVSLGFFQRHSSSQDTETEADYKTVKVMTEYRAYCAFQEWQQTDKVVNCWEQSTYINSCVTW